MSNRRGDRLEVWGGPECTVNRVGDQYFDQIVRTGHDDRPDDLDLFAELGLKAVRYPVLWERHLDPIDWGWADARLTRLKQLNIRPIVGLIHHGSGPPHTSLLDPEFAIGLAQFAGRFAERFPWVGAYTPVNEPLTTARFSGLYGHWYPHGRDNATFARCFLTQCRAIVLSMRAIRRINPAAELIQTEDFGQTHAPRPLRYQADFENERRWLTWDLLCGRVDRSHPMRAYLRWTGILQSEIDWFLKNPCPPSVLGVNHYVTSERYLDPRLDFYAPEMHGGNGRHEYVDTEAVRLLPGGAAGVHSLLRKVWERYRMPMAITEAHIGCTPDEQVRWIWEMWQAATKLRHEGADVRAVTAWSVFGAYDWDSLVTRAEGHYEPGAFDVATDPPRPTAVAELIRELAAGRTPSNTAINTPGWWRRPERFAAHARDRELVSCS